MTTIQSWSFCIWNVSQGQWPLAWNTYPFCSANAFKTSTMFLQSSIPLCSLPSWGILKYRNISTMPLGQIPVASEKDRLMLTHVFIYSGRIMLKYWHWLGNMTFRSQSPQVTNIALPGSSNKCSALIHLSNDCIVSSKYGWPSTMPCIMPVSSVQKVDNWLWICGCTHWWKIDSVRKVSLFTFKHGNSMISCGLICLLRSQVASKSSTRK